MSTRTDEAGQTDQADQAGAADHADQAGAADDDARSETGSTPITRTSGYPEPTTLRARVTRQVKRAIPVVSLLVGIAGAVMMDRGPQRAVVVAWATIGAWLALATTQWLGRPRTEADDGRAGDDAAIPATAPVAKDTAGGDTGGDRDGDRGAAAVEAPLHVRALRYSSLMATQSLVQLSLFFALPFFVRAMSLDPGHLLFMLGLSAMCVVSLWDPWSEALLSRPLLSSIMPAAGTFVVLVAVLPGLGISTSLSLWLAAAAAVGGVPLVAAATASPRRRRRAALSGLGLAMVLPLGLYFGGARFVPPAPLRLVKAEIGTQVANKWVSDPTDHFDTPPAQLVCATAIGSPLGLHDEMFHVWTHAGEEVARIGLDIVGGREGGYRTRSRFRGFKRDPQGTYTCRVETGTGQLLGATSVTLGD